MKPESLKALPSRLDLYEEQVVIVAKYNKTGGSHSDFHVAACEYMKLEMLIRAEEKKTSHFSI
jgi:hypothetical protein